MSQQSQLPTTQGIEMTETRSGQGMTSQMEGQTGGITEDQMSQSGGPMGGQMGQAGGMTQSQMGGMHGQMAQTRDMVLPQQMRTVLDSIAQAVQVCAWCADMCTQEADPHMIECIKLCEDVTELGESVLALAPRNSYFTQEILQTFQHAAQACAQECSMHEHAHCQECATVLDQALTASQQLTTPATQNISQ